MGNQLNHCSCCFVQGGGLLINGGTIALDSCSIYENIATYVSVKKRALFPVPHWENLAKASALCCLQGGGAYIYGSNTQETFISCAIYSNTANWVRCYFALS